MSLQEKKNNLNNWVKFSQVGIQMAVTVGLCAYGGYSLDGKYPTIAPWGTVGGSLFGVFVSLYMVIKQVNQMKN